MEVRPRYGPNEPPGGERCVRRQRCQTRSVHSYCVRCGSEPRKIIYRKRGADALPGSLVGATPRAKDRVGTLGHLVTGRPAAVPVEPRAQTEVRPRGFCSPFLVGVPLSMIPGSSTSPVQTSMPTSPSPSSEQIGTPNPPAIRFTRGKSFGTSRFTHLLGLPSCSLPCTDQTDMLGPRELLLPGFQRIGCPPCYWI